MLDKRNGELAKKVAEKTVYDEVKRRIDEIVARTDVNKDGRITEQGNKCV